MPFAQLRASRQKMELCWPLESQFDRLDHKRWPQVTGLSDVSFHYTFQWLGSQEVLYGDRNYGASDRGDRVANLSAVNKIHAWLKTYST